MPRAIAFLRAINVGGHTVTMERLRALFESFGFVKVETFIASGNVIFETDTAVTAQVEKAIENHLRPALGFAAATFVRTQAEVAAIAAYNPFGDRSGAEKHPLKTALGNPPGSANPSSRAGAISFVEKWV
jgi:uncharacterized protein (DUF1697 family)